MIKTGFYASVLGVFTSLFSGVLKLLILSALLITLCEGVPFYKMLILLLVFLVAVLWLYIGSFVSLGYLNFNLSFLDQRESCNIGLFDPATDWWSSVYVRLNILFRSCLAGIIFIVPGIISYYSYALAPFLLEEQKNITVEEALIQSRLKMKGHRFEYFCLRLSFIGWKILGYLTLGIAFLWINPYYAMSETVFFNEISGRADALYNRE